MTTREEALEVISRIEKLKRPQQDTKIDQVNHGILFILRYVAEHENKVSSGELAKKMNVSTARVAALANKLEEKGILLRIPDEKDLRKTYFSLTEKGLEMHRKRKEDFISLVQYTLDHLEKNEFEEFLRIYEKMRHISAEYVENHPVRLLEEVDNA